MVLRDMCSAFLNRSSVLHEVMSSSGNYGGQGEFKSVLLVRVPSGDTLTEMDTSMSWMAGIFHRVSSI